MTIKTINATEAKRLVDQGAVIVDIREPSEFQGENIPGALNWPLSRLAEVASGGAAAVVFHCKSGARTRMNAQALAGCTDAGVKSLTSGAMARISHEKKPSLY